MSTATSLAYKIQVPSTAPPSGKADGDIEFSGSMSWLQDVYKRIPRGSVHLIGGRPGAGKTGILLQAGLGLVAEGYRVHFVLTEQAVDRVVDRLGLLLADKKKAVERSARNRMTLDDQISDVSHLPDYVLGLLARSSWNNERPDFLIVDSIHGTGINSNSTKVYKRIYDLFHLTRSTGLVLFAVGHCNKDNSFAGPQTLAHNVDTLTMIQTCWRHRFVLCHKNRFGEARGISRNSLQRIPIGCTRTQCAPALLGLRSTGRMCSEIFQEDMSSPRLNARKSRNSISLCATLPL